MDDLKHLRGLIHPDWLKRLADPMADMRQQMQAAYLDPLREARERMQDVDGMQDIAEQWKAATGGAHDAIQSFLDEQRRHREELAKLLQPNIGWQQAIQDITDPIRGLGITIRDYLDALGLGSGSEWLRVLEQFRECLDQLPAETRVQVTVLIQRGWCLDPEMTHAGLQEMVFAIEDGEEIQVQEALMDYFRSRLDAIEAAVCERHPSHAAILTDAFKAHREGRYHLSVPVFLAQADGITHEQITRQLYSKRRQKGVAGFVETLPADDFPTIFWSGFTADGPLTRDTRELPAGFDGLNRHAVLHGTDTSYGTEVNSLRALSVLNLASYLLKSGGRGPGGNDLADSALG